MQEKLKIIVKKLEEQNKTISTMESCTGGGLVNEFTNIEGASQVLKFSAVTYSNEFKIKLGVSKDVIDKYSVYSKQTAIEMSKNISEFAGSDYGIGITGKLNRIDVNNLYGDNSTVYVSIYDKNLDKFYNYDIIVNKTNREENKDMVIEFVIDKLLEILGD